jgi:hypothetical protein
LAMLIALSRMRSSSANVMGFSSAFSIRAFNVA